MPILQKSYGSSEPEYLHKYISHVAKIKPNSVVVYKRYIGFNTGKTEAELENLKKGRDGEYNGFMSPATARKVRTLLENWLLILEQKLTDDWQIPTPSALADKSLHHDYYPTFVTLTLPSKQLHDDNTIKRNLLNRFIIQLKNTHNVEHYFWRAEPQKNGNIHFHILVDRWIHWKAIRSDWNKILNDHGYIEAYRQNQQARHREGFKPDPKEFRERLNRIREHRSEAGQQFDRKSETKRILQKMRQAWEEGVKNNWSDPNSTDIHAIEKVENLTAYVVKYVTKTDGADEVREISEDGEQEILTTRSRKIGGRIWGCSDGLRNLKHFEQEIAEEHDYRVHTYDTVAFEFVRQLDKEATARKEANPDDDSMWKDEDSGTAVYRLDQKSYALLRSTFPQLFAQYSDHYKQCYNELYEKNSYYMNNNKILLSMFDSSDNPTDLHRHEKVNTIPDFSSWLVPVDECPF